MKYTKIIYFIFILFLNTNLYSKMIFAFEYANPNNSYGLELLKLSFDKTKEKYGEYEIKKAPQMNRQRSLLILKSNQINNLILRVSASKKRMKDFSCIPFPVDRGIVGYRIAFISPKINKRIKEYNTLDKIKKLNIGQGIGWLDINILKYNGFKLTQINNKESLFNMLKLNRIDLFLRGVNEIYNEIKIYKTDLDKNFIFYYPLPRFFCVNKKNKLLYKRINEGIKIAYKDGSIDNLFNKYYKKSIDFLEIKKRKLYKLENPFLEGIDKSYEKYIYNPYN